MSKWREKEQNNAQKSMHLLKIHKKEIAIWNNKKRYKKVNKEGTYVFQDYQHYLDEKKDSEP